MIKTIRNQGKVPCLREAPHEGGSFLLLLFVVTSSSIILKWNFNRAIPYGNRYDDVRANVTSCLIEAAAKRRGDFFFGETPRLRHRVISIIFKGDTCNLLWCNFTEKQ